MVAVLEIVVGQAPGLGLFGDCLLCLLDEVDAEEDGEDGEELGDALDGHDCGPVGRVLVDRFDLAQLLDVLEGDEDHAEEGRGDHQDDDPDDLAHTWRVGLVILPIRHLVDCLDQTCSHVDVGDDKDGKPGRGGEIDPSEVALVLRHDVEGAPPDGVEGKEDPEADSKALLEATVVELLVTVILKLALQLVKVHEKGGEGDNEVARVRRTDRDVHGGTGTLPSS